MPDQSLGRAIRARRQALGLTQEALAARVGAGVQQSDISRLERDQITLPHPGRVRALARALDLPAGELLVRAGWPGAAQPAGGQGPVVAPVPPGAAVPPAGPRLSGVGPTRLGQALLEAQTTAQATARSLARADAVWAWALDPRASRQPCAAGARDRGRDGIPAAGGPTLDGSGSDEHDDPRRR